MVRVAALEALHGRHTHLGVDVSVFAVVLPHARPARVAPQVDHRGESPRHATGACLVSRNRRSAAHKAAVERSAHVHSLRKERAVEGVSHSVDFVYSVNAGYADGLHRLFLYLADGPRPHFLLLGDAKGHVEQRAYLVFSDYSVKLGLAQCKAVGAALVEVGHYVDGYFTHLPYLLIQRHTLQPRLYVSLDCRVRLDGRWHGRACRCNTCAGTQGRHHCHVSQFVHNNRVFYMSAPLRPQRHRRVAARAFLIHL